MPATGTDRFRSQARAALVSSPAPATVGLPQTGGQVDSSSGLEQALAPVEQDLETAVRVGSGVIQELKRARAAAATGQTRELRRSLAAAVTQADEPGK